MHRLIVMSATYRQSSRVTPELLAKDPENRLLARGPRVRLEAEVIRDSALAGQRPALGEASAARASSRRSRPASRPREPMAASTWKVSPGGDRYRRGLYTFSKRTAPYAMFDDLRRAQRRGLRRAPRGLQHAAPGADAAQRPGVRRGRAGAGPDRWPRSAGSVEDRVDVAVPALPDPAAGRRRAGACSSQFFQAQKRPVRAQGARRRQDRRPGRRRCRRTRGLDRPGARAPEPRRGRDERAEAMNRDRYRTAVTVTRRHFFRGLRRRRRQDRPGRLADATRSTARTFGVAAGIVHDRWHPERPTSHPRRSASSTCSWPVRPASSTCSTTSPR